MEILFQWLSPVLILLGAFLVIFVGVFLFYVVDSKYMHLLFVFPTFIAIGFLAREAFSIDTYIPIISSGIIGLITVVIWAISIYNQNKYNTNNK